MSTDTRIKDSNYYFDWLEKSISEKRLKYHDYSEFKNLQLIGNSSFGNIVRANWKNDNDFVTLKSFNNDTKILKNVVEELKLYRNVDNHENILQFYGITKLETEYSLVMEYSDDFLTLNNYLNKHFEELDWCDKYQLALQLASAVEFMHDCDIIHHNLVI
ncbi:kinase-like domain-containing protein [Glomus cerebriforme]|uniref:Kinase-like domain-containing protein n=1 Tax=Glomus cerebriforme TaxID=658196 RepID=A0A397S276_9GLOM|nr:kinase-like domain-containing protein [Glomus cerebriforme]